MMGDIANTAPTRSACRPPDAPCVRPHARSVTLEGDAAAAPRRSHPRAATLIGHRPVAGPLTAHTCVSDYTGESCSVLDPESGDARELVELAVLAVSPRVG